MAVVRARSAPPYGLITFIALWVITTGFAVLFYLNWVKADLELADKTKLYDKVAKQSEAGAIGKSIADQSKDSSLSYLAAANKQLSDLKIAIVGDPNAQTAAVLDAAQRAKRLGGANAQSLVATVNNLASARDTAQAQVETLTKSLNSINETISAEGANELASHTSMEAEMAKQADANAAADGAVDRGAEEATVDANDAAQKLINDATDKADEVHRADVIAMQGLNSQINKNLSIIAELNARIHLVGTSAHPYVGEPDGQIVRVNPGAGEAYINLNMPRDRMVAGMTFTVYDPRTGVRFGDDNEAMGMGSIEVIEPGEVNSLVRITRTTKGMAITEGDLIANQVYQANKGRQYHFVVFGDFDLDGDGIATAHERERLESLIVSWGGVIDKEITAQTDYLVLGARPKSPSISLDEPAATGSAASQRGKVQDAYDSIQGDAQRLSVPILNANRFLSMIGYYSTTIVRH